jgi:hypothetical protein
MLEFGGRYNRKILVVMWLGVVAIVVIASVI